MAKLWYRYSAMNAGKSTMAMQVAHNYEELEGKVLVWKPMIDTKGEDTIVSRIGITRKVDRLLSEEESPINIIKIKLNEKEHIDAIIIDEAQFLTEEQVNELFYISKKFNITILCYGLRCDFQMKPFPGSARLLAIADSIEELKTMCKCKKRKATQNLRFINGLPTFEGDQVAIDGEDQITYESVCGECYINYYLEWKKNKEETLKRERKRK
ncbi:thymidine kinase [Mycoplasma sp. CAG:776]|nr:thymidine kinase [Mycoplasma sp. CAG:776]